MGENLRVVIRGSNSVHPVCEHGPALLFERRSGNECHQFYACSAYRDSKDCPLHIPVDETKPVTYNIDFLIRHPKNATKIALDIASKWPAVLNENPSERIYCHTCYTFVVDKNITNKHNNHEIRKGVSDEQIKQPTTFLRSLSNDKKEAQYFFSDASLKCFAHIFQRLKINKIVCIGAPRLHEYLKYNKSKLRIESILLDLDTRFYWFCNQNSDPSLSRDYFHYNMFNNYFFAGPEAKEEFNNFLREQNNEKCCIFTDPPFGCRTEPLVSTLKSLSKDYRHVNQSHNILPIFWVFPYFMETYITSQMPEMEMLDYKIDYTNHESYHSGHDGRKLGSPVRLFTNVPNYLIDLPTDESYRLCKKCKRWVARENQHCNRCKKCPSKNGATYVHCNLCETCVKPTYRHCNNCWRCTQIENHECSRYQSQLKCTICLQKGHNELNCNEWFAKCQKNLTEINKLKLKSIKTGRRICLLCFKTGHNEQSCSMRKQLLNETSFLSHFYNLLTPEPF